MIPHENESQETINREQQDDAQVLDASDMEGRDGTNFESEESRRGGKPDPAEIVPDDRPDLVETMEGMRRSGQIDNGAYDGERVDDDEEEMLGDTDDENEDALIETEAEDEILGVSSDDDPDTARG